MRKRKLRQGERLRSTRVAVKKKEADEKNNNHNDGIGGHQGENHLNCYCLFCFKTLSSSSVFGTLANVIEEVFPGGLLQTTLNDPQKNREAFGVLCNRLKVDWEEDQNQNGPLALNLERSLPLCSPCQRLYQELYQLEVQIKELERMLQGRALLIQRKITESWRKSNATFSSGNILVEWLKRFRLKVVESEGGHAKDPLSSIEIHEPKIEVPFPNRGESDYEENGFFFEDDAENMISETNSEAGSDYNQYDDKDEGASSGSEEASLNVRKKVIPTSTTKTPKKCHACWKDLGPSEKIKSHFKNEHPGLDPCQCPECGKKCSTVRDCRRHAVRHIPDMKQKQCDQCEMSFYTKGELKHHVARIHEKKEKTSDVRLMVMCKSCGSCVTNARRFYFHNKRRHGGQAECTKPIPEEDVEKLRESLNIKSPKVFTQCHVCWEGINQCGGVKAHFEKEHPGMDLNQCSKCGKKFKEYSDCRKHAWRHISENKSFQCDQCPMRFFKNFELQNHIATHVPPEERQKYVCDICSKVLTSKLGLDAHLRTHRLDKPRWVCEDCGRSYVYKKGYLEHKKIKHLELMPVKCPQCPKVFPLKSYLTKHLSAAHSKLRPFKCHLCDKTFPYSSGMSRHVREVHCKDERAQVKKKKRKVESVFELQPSVLEGKTDGIGNQASENNDMEVDTKHGIETDTVANINK